MTLRTRLALGFAVIFAVVIGAAVFTVTSQRTQLYDQIDDRLVSTPLPPNARIPPAGGEEREAPPVDPPERVEPEAVDTESISDLYVAVVDADAEGEFMLRAVIEGQLLVDVPDTQSIITEEPTESTLTTVDGIDGASTFRLLYLPATETTLGVVFAVPLDSADDTIRQLTYTFIGVAAVILLVVVLIASWISRFGLRPISAMTDVAEAISSGDRERRAPLDTPSTEAGRLGHAFNVMLDEHDTSDTRLRQFVSNASHELRTPLTSIRGYLDLYAAGGFREPGQLDDAIRRMQVEAERMNLLVEDLLVLAKFDEEQPLDITAVRVDQLVHDVAALTLAAHPEREVIVDASDEVVISADRLRLHQAVAALLDNAVRHTPDEAAIRVGLAHTADEIVLSVADSGPGLTADEALSVFDRFSRGDRSRARRTGGSGLGLSITQAIVHAHGGEISATATPGDGATFTIELPVGATP